MDSPRKSRPAGAASDLRGDEESGESIPPRGYAELHERAADHVLHCAWLTVNASLLFEYADCGMVAACLLDLRDLLEDQWSA